MSNNALSFDMKNRMLNLEPSNKNNSIKPRKTFKVSKKSVLITLLVLINIGVFLGVIYLVYKNVTPVSTNDTLGNNSEIVDKVAKLITLDPTQTPQVGTINDVDTLKQNNVVLAQVYKDAQNGDYLLAYTDKYIIFRDSENKIIYNGDSPSKIISDTQKKVTDKIALLVKSAKILTVDDTEDPQLSPVTDDILQNAASSDFYKDVKKDDVIGLFSKNHIIVIYRPSSDNLVSMGSYETVIHVL